MADQVLYSGVACITDLMVKEGLIHLDFADVRSVMREMGKAMMGTGEASGDGRALAAAEAAIANPLLDETSMKGAKGLLISITGGRDLTLFEVDEAATRIREEVDQEANIILGATFDENLEGVIRVSVVATGIDKPASEMSAQPLDFRQAMKPINRQPAKQEAPAARAPETAYAAAAPIRAADPVAAVIEQAQAEFSNAPEEDFQPQSRIFHAPAPEMIDRQPAPAIRPQPVHHREPLPAPMPAAAELRPAPRMPNVEDFPPITQAQYGAQMRSAPEAEDERGPMGLLKRLTHGLSRREEEPARFEPARPREPALGQAESRRQLSNDASIYAPRRGQLDEHGRPQPQNRPNQDDDHLEIPAFLRRQTS